MGRRWRSKGGAVSSLRREACRVRGEKVTELVRNQILSQTGVAMLAQDNSLPRMLAGLLDE